MNQEDLSLLLRNSLNNPATDNQITHIAEIVSNSSKSACRSFVRRLKRILKSPNYKPSFKLHTLKIIQACANTENISFIVYLYKKLLSKLIYLAEFQKESSEVYRGQLLFGATSQEQRIASAEFLILFLQCIENWAERFGKDVDGNPTGFEETYLSLKEKGVVFPPVNYIIEMPKEIKKEVHKCKRVIRTVLNMEENNVDCQAIKNDILELKKFKTYFVNEAAGFVEKGMEKYVQDLYEIIDKISIVINDYKERKNRGKVVHKEVNFNKDLIPMNVLGIRLTNEINDALPKFTPRVDSPIDYLFDELEQQEISFVRSEINISFDQESLQEDWSQINNEYCNVKDKLAEYEELIQSYSNDLLKLQEKYLEAVEEREEIKLRIGSIINENVELHNENNSLMEKIKALEVENSSKKEEIDAYKSQNHFLKCTLKAIQEESLKCDKQIVKYLKQIDHLEDINKSLTKDNEKLQAELVKIHKFDQEFKLKITPAKFIAPETQRSFKERSQSCEHLGNQVEKEFYKPNLPMRKNTMQKEQSGREDLGENEEIVRGKNEILHRNIINRSPELEEEEEKKQEPNESTKPKLKWKNEEKEKQHALERKLDESVEKMECNERFIDIGGNLGSVSDG